MPNTDYEIVMGLEVHVELKTKTKIFCSCENVFGGDPNTHCCPICIGMPGTLPVLNENVVTYALLAGLATHCEINTFSKQDRKNYFYPDLPKAYQVSQYDLPLCYKGYVDIEAEGEVVRIGLTRIHIEEDAGKLLHEATEGSLVDYNRCGVPLIEIVSEPDFRSAEQVRAYLEKLRTILLYADVSDCKMNEGSLRCDVNLSIRKIGSDVLGTRTEMKNMNSFNFIVKAIEYEAKRQIKVLESGQKVVQETRRYDEQKGITVSMRSKEEAHDYRYFPEPDLMPIVTSQETLDALKMRLPTLPDARKALYLETYGITDYDAKLIVASRHMADFFETACKTAKSPKSVANWIITEVFSRITESDKETGHIPLAPVHLAQLVNLIEDGSINARTAKEVFGEVWTSGASPESVVQAKGLTQISDDGALKSMAEAIIAANPKPVADYLAGKDAALQALMGQMMKKTQGKANPGKVIALLKGILDPQK